MSVRTLPDLPHCGRFPYTLLALSIAAFGQHAIAAESAAASAETIVVIGQAARIQQALDVQQASDAIVSVVHADGIGALPDANVAEALQRVPGVSIERDQGEGRYVRVRGLGPDLNGVTVNGTTLPSPESGRRAVMLDTIPSALIRSLEVQKTLTPDQDASSIGGTVEIKTRSAFDAPGRFLSLETLASHDGNTGQTSPKFDLAWSDRLARGKLGMAAGLSWEKRKFGSDNIETGGAWDVSGSQALLNKFEQRDYRIERERLGAALNVEYKPEAGSRYYVRGLYTRFDDREERQSTLVSFSKPQAEGASSSAKISRALKSREEIQQVRSLNLGAEQKLGDWKLLVAGGVSHASETEPEYLTGVEFAGKSSFSGTGYRNAARPELFAPASSRDAGQFALTKAKAPMSDSHDRERNLRIDGERSTVLGDAGVAIKFGAKFSRRDKDYDKTSWAFKNLGKAPAALPKAALELGSYLNGNTGWGLGEFGPRIDEAGVRALFAGIAHDSYLDQSASQIEDYRIKEDRDAAYVQSSVEFGNWRWLGGVRFEGSRHHLQGTGLRDGVFLPTVADRRDRHWLPALQLRHDISDATSVRAAITHSVVHPTFAQMRPGLLIDVAAGEAAFGNPDLKPLTSRNLDLGIESRLGKASTVSAYVFHKRINDFIYSADLAGSGRWAGFNSVATFANGSAASVSGIELNYSRDFKSLPAPWNGVLIGANLTATHSRAAIERRDAAGVMRSRDIALPNASERSANLMLGYETAAWNARIAANYKSRYLLQIGDTGDARRDAYVDAQTQWDLSASVRLSKQMQLVLEGLNLSDEPYYVYLGDRSRNYQYEQYGRTWKIGLKFAMN